MISLQILKATLHVVQSIYYFADQDDLEPCEGGYKLSAVWKKNYLFFVTVLLIVYAGHSKSACWPNRHSESCKWRGTPRAWTLKC